MNTKVKQEKPEETAPSAELATVQTGALMAPSFMGDEDFGGGGFEGTDKDSFAIPFLQILQKMSPMVDEDDPKYLAGAKAGMLYNTVTQRLYDGKEGFIIIPCAYRRSYIQWAGREAEGGFKGEFTPEQITEMQSRDEIIAVDGKLLKPLADGTTHDKKSDYFADTRSHFILIIDPETGESSKAILALSGSQVKSSKTLMTALQQKKVETRAGKMTPPTFANLVKLTTVGLSNDKGNWSGTRFDLSGLVTDAKLYEEAKSFYKAISAGEVKVDHSKSDYQSNEGAPNVPTNADEF